MTLNVDFNGYVKTLVSFLFKFHEVDTNKIAPRIEVEDVSLSIETAIPCGLLVNELITNSLKHAFPGERKGELKISLRSISEDDLELIVSDDGIGIHREGIRHEKTEKNISAKETHPIQGQGLRICCEQDSL